jgi:Rha family phage regulatory protein
MSKKDAEMRIKKMNELTTINILKVDDRIMVSSKEVAEKFDKEHKNVLRDIENLQLPDKFKMLNFELIYDKDTYGREQKTYLMTKDGFFLLAFGFTGKIALQWKLGFLDAFNKMEHTILEQLPALKSEIELLKKENIALNREMMLLPAPKKPHGNKGTVTVPIAVNTLFGIEIEQKRVPKDSPNYSTITYKEGKAMMMVNLIKGLTNRVGILQEEIAIERRK